MSYSIVFETKIVNLPDGRIIHFDRSGCSNDDAGRRQGEFTGKIYIKDEFVQRAENFKKDSKPYREANNWDLKIGSRYATYFDYGEHLLRMLKRATDCNEFATQNYIRAQYCRGIQVIEPEQKEITLEEFDKAWSDFMRNGGCRYRRIMEHLESIEEMVKCLDADEPLEFYIRKVQ